MKICFFSLNLSNPVINAVFGGMYKSFWQALRSNNVTVSYSNSPDSLDGDFLVVSLGGGQERKAAKAMAQFKGPVIIYVPPAFSWFYASFLKRWKDKIIFAYGTDSSELSFKKFQSLKIPYYHFPFASDENIFKPLHLPKLYDIIFVGNATSGIGRYRYTNLLIETAKKKNWEVLMLGSGWEKYGYPFQIIAHGKLMNVIYNTGKICLNIHNDIQYKGQPYQMDANNRVFDLAMAGCFQISNAKNLIEKYFNDNEVFAIDDPVKWIEKIEYFLQNENERIQLGENSRQRALLEHTWDKRAKSFINMIVENQSGFKENIKVGLKIKIARSLDQYMIPTYQLKDIRLVKFFNPKKWKI